MNSQNRLFLRPDIASILVLSCTLATSALAGAGPGGADFEPGVVIVRYAPFVRGAMADQVAARHGATIEERNLSLDYARLRLGAARTVEATLPSLRLDSAILWAQPNYYYGVVGLHDVPQDSMLVPLEDQLAPAGRNQWGIFQTGIPWLWRQGGLPGDGIVVAIVDSGLDDFPSPHPDLAANVFSAGKDFVDGDEVPTDVGAARGHGTHVAGIVAAVSNDRGGAGVAYGAKLMIVRTMDCTVNDHCPGTSTAIASGIRWAADHGARVVNLSLGGPGAEPLLREAVQYAIGKGTLVVAAAGNDSSTTLNYPAGYEEVIAVGAVDSLDHVPVFSTSGSALDLVAPGTRIWSTYLGGGYRRLSGTSMATPLVAGVAAVIAGRNPGIKQLEMERYLRAHVVPLEGADGERDGAGRLSFPPLEDWDDLPPPYPAAQHRNFLWEWLGRDASGERSFADPLSDSDFRPNIGAPGAADGHDDGVFPTTFPRLPFLPTHLGVPSSTLDLTLSVSKHDGPRYGADPSRSLHLDVWIDWDSDGAFEEDPGAAEHVVDDLVENPAAWTSDAKLISRPFEPVDGHIKGNPLCVRSRLSYGSSPGDAGTSASFGEVEDVCFVNFVEDFDTNHRPHDPGIYTISDGWTTASDPAGGCAHHGNGGMARSFHPNVGGPCNGFIEAVSVMATPMMNWEEYTTAKARFWYCHQGTFCGGGPDLCRLRIDANGTKTDLGPIPMGSGTLEVDLSAFVGHDVVILEFVEETDRNGFLFIDDVVVTAFDGDRASTATSLAAIGTPGAGRADLLWYTPRDNEVAPGPPVEQQAHIYDIRYATAPITSEAAWEAAFRLAPADITSGAQTFVPGTAGVEQSVTLRLPSAFQGYGFNLRAMDEVTNLSALSSSPTISGAAAPGVAVVPPAPALGAPGDSIVIPFHASNIGDTADSYALSASSLRGWSLIDMPNAITLEAGTGADFDVVLLIPTSAIAGEADTITFVATSMADPLVSDAADGVVAVSGASMVNGELPWASIDALRLTGSNPTSERIGITLALRVRQRVSLRVIGAGGRVVRTLAERDLGAGNHDLAWDLRDDQGFALPSGIYFLDARLGETHTSRRLVVLK